MSDNQIALLIGPTLLLLFAPTSLGQYRQRQRIWNDEGVRRALSSKEKPEHTRGRWLLGVALATTWAVGLLLVVNLG